jgi:hypothetical protein
MQSRMRISGRLVYAGTIITLLALVAGFVIASITVTQSNQSAQGNYVTATGAVTGVSYTSTVLSYTPSPAPTAPTGTAAAPQAVAAGANNFCITATCTAYDPAQVVTYTFTAGMTGSIQISYVIQTTTGPASIATTVYLKQAATAVAGTIVLVADLGTTGATITGTTLSVQECSGATCP